MAALPPGRSSCWWNRASPPSRGSLLWHTPLILERKTTSPWKCTPTSVILQQTGGKKPALPWAGTQQGWDLRAGRALQHPSPASFPHGTRVSHGRD